jgi:hypothetical protein
VEGRLLLRTLQTAVAQDQVVAYDLHRRHCRHCGAYRQIKDWRPRVFTTGLGEIRVRVPRVVSCLCTPEPLDDHDEPRDLRYSECPIETLLPSRRTPEVSYLCAKHGASSSYRTAAQHVVVYRRIARAESRERPERNCALRRTDRGCTVNKRCHWYLHCSARGGISMSTESQTIAP